MSGSSGMFIKPARMTWIVDRQEYDRPPTISTSQSRDVAPGVRFFHLRRSS